MISIFAVVVFAATPSYNSPPTHSGNNVPHVMHDHRHRIDHHRRYYGGGYIGNYYEPDASEYDGTEDEEPAARPAVIYLAAPSLPVVQQKFTFPTYTEIVVKGAPVGNGCTYKSVMSDDDINACKRAAHNEFNKAK